LLFGSSLQFVTDLAYLREPERGASPLQVVTQRTNSVEVGAGKRGRNDRGVPSNVIEKFGHDGREFLIYGDVEFRCSRSFVTGMRVSGDLDRVQGEEQDRR
jgi:hypothetical protein